MDAASADQVRAICDEDEDAARFVREMSSRLGDKWSVRVLAALGDDVMRFTALMEALAPISHRVLTATLRCLEMDGMVNRAAYAESPPRVEYSLTPLGENFLTGALSFVAWAQDHQLEIEGHRALNDKSARRIR